MVATNFTTPKNNDRLTQLWEDLLAEPVPPHPAATGWKAAGAPFEMNSESVLFLGIDELKSTSRPWRVDLAKMFHSLLETVDAELPSPAPGEVISEADGFSNTSAVAAHEAALALSSSFHWEPKPAWINAPVRSGSSPLNPAGPQRFVARPKIPLRPLHKQPLYMRILFCLRRWLSRKSKTKV